MSGVSAATVSSPSANASRSGAFRCASWLTRRATSSSSSRGSRTSWSNDSGMSWRQLGNWPSIRREESATPPARKTAWLRGIAISTSRRPRSRSSRASSRSARAGTFASIGCASARLELGVLDRQAVGVGRDHRQGRALGLDQDAGQDRAHLVARGRAGDPLDRLGERRRRQLRRLALDLGQAREVLGRAACAGESGRSPAVSSTSRCSGRSSSVTLAVGQAADDVDEEAAGQQDGALALDLDVVERQGDAQLHVGRTQRERAVRGDEAGCRRARAGSLRAETARPASWRAADEGVAWS